MLLALLACAPAPEASDEAPPAELVAENSASDCPAIEAAFECELGPTGDVTDLWRESFGSGWPEVAVWSSPASTNLYLRPADGYRAGTVDLDLTAADLSAVQIVTSCCRLPNCPWEITDGAAHVSGELTDCSDGTEECLTGTLTFELTALTFATGGSTQAMTLSADY